LECLGIGEESNRDWSQCKEFLFGPGLKPIFPLGCPFVGCSPTLILAQRQEQKLYEHIR
jgi:hypothetical protein